MVAISRSAWRATSRRAPARVLHEEGLEVRGRVAERGERDGVLGEDPQAQVLEHRHDVGEHERLAEVELEGGEGVGATRRVDDVDAAAGAGDQRLEVADVDDGARRVGRGLVLVGEDARRSARRAPYPAASPCSGDQALAQAIVPAARQLGDLALQLVAADGQHAGARRRQEEMQAGVRRSSPSARWSSTTSPAKRAARVSRMRVADGLREGVARQDHHHGDAALERVGTHA